MEGMCFMCGTGVGGRRGGKAQDGSDGNWRLHAYACAAWGMAAYLHTYRVRPHCTTYKGVVLETVCTRNLGPRFIRNGP